MKSSGCIIHLITVISVIMFHHIDDIIIKMTFYAKSAY